jgi:hypothetical protein
MARSGSEPHNVRLLRAVLVEHILYPERAAGINQPDSLEAPRYAASTTLVLTMAVQGKRENGRGTHTYPEPSLRSRPSDGNGRC